LLRLFGSSIRANAMLSPGDKVKDCEVIAPLGSGGMARLYLARRRGVGGFSRLVTLKLVHPHLIEDENIIKLFLDEARISAHVAHPNVVNVEEVGRYGDSYFIAMEYVHGVSLAELLARLTERRLRLRTKLCVWFAAQVSEALHAAHEAKGENGVPLNIVHRDVSPQNVLIGHTGHVKLIDFGIARSHSENDQRLGDRTVLGKLRYMAPEQLRLEHADRRTDVYALGVMLWEMLAGRNMLRCQRFDDERDWAIRENPPPPSKYSSHSTPLLDRVVLKAIACEPNQRYDSAFQFRAALLRAEPAAVKLDAPMVAALMRSMIGDELDRRRASWPSEVAGELEPKADITTSQGWNLEELTANLNISVLAGSVLGATASEHEDPANDVDAGGDEAEETTAAAPDDEDEPTFAIRSPVQPSASLEDSVSELELARADPTLSIASAHVSFASLQGSSEPRGRFDTPSASVALKNDITLLGVPVVGVVPQSAIDTLKVPPVSLDFLEALPASRGVRAAIAGSLCLAFGVFMGAFLTPPPAKSEPIVVVATPGVPMEPEPTLTAQVDPKILTGSQPAARDPSAERECHTLVDVERASRTARREARLYARRSGRAAKLANRQNSSGSKSSSNHRSQTRFARSSE
jgi:serine/threonine-protein kinase